MARQTATETVRMPKQFVRPGRGKPGYKSAEGVKIETFETPEYRNASAREGARGARGQGATPPTMTNAQRREKLDTLGVKDVPARASSAELDKLIADAEAGGNGGDGGTT